MGFLQRQYERLGNLLGFLRTPEAAAFEVRGGIYSINEMLYGGRAYATRHNGGALEDILKTYIGSAFCDVNRNRIVPFLSPFKEIVDAYQYVLPGTWGNGVKIADTFDGKPINPKLLPALASVWRMSNLDTEKAKVVQWAANNGTVGMRVTARPADGERAARVAIAADHPSRLFNFEEDSEGNVTAVCLKYQLQVNRGTLADPDWETVEVVEEFTKDDFSVKHGDVQQLEDAARKNAMGFCPYVILRHKDNGTRFGDWAYRGSEEAVHRINWRVSRQDKSIDRHQFPNWFFTAGGDAPTTPIDMGDSKAWYVQSKQGTPPPSAEAIVPQIDQTGAQEFWMELRNMIRGRQPELNLNDVKMLSGVSGETLAQILKPTEKVISDARPGYWHGFTRALQMGVSAGVSVGAWDVGTGTGEGAADAAYRAGLENFTFDPMTPLLPSTPQQELVKSQAKSADAKAKLQVAQSAKAIGLPTGEQWRLAGYTDAQIVKLKGELQKQSELPSTATGPTFPVDDGVAA